MIAITMITMTTTNGMPSQITTTVRRPNSDKTALTQTFVWLAIVMMVVMCGGRRVGMLVEVLLSPKFVVPKFLRARKGQGIGQTTPTLHIPPKFVAPKLLRARKGRGIGQTTPVLPIVLNCPPCEEERGCMRATCGEQRA